VRACEEAIALGANAVELERRPLTLKPL